MPTVVMLMGVPASGKTTIREELISGSYRWNNDLWVNDNSNIVVISSNDVVTALCERHGTDYNNGFFKYIKDAESISKGLLKYFLLAGSDIIIDRTNVTAKGRKELISLINQYSSEHRIHGISLLDKDIDTVLSQNKDRLDKTISESVIREMDIRKEKPCISEGFDILVTSLSDYWEQL